MIDSPALLAALQRQLGSLLGDLRERVEADPAVGDPLQAEYQRAFDAERTGWTFTEWSEDRLTQVAVGWLLACVFVRFCEDNGLIDDAMLAGEGQRGTEARAAQQDFFKANPHSSDRDYLHHVFRTAAALRGLDDVLGDDQSPLWLVDPSADACTDLIALFRSVDDDGMLVFEFTDASRDTRFLGDLYQDLSEHAKKTYALLQTPEFVEELILDRTLDPAIESVGLSKVSLIDPTCGSGHFLLGAFDRLWQRWYDAEPAMPPEERAERALDAVWGVDLNPFAAAIARFRLLVAAMVRCNQTRLADGRRFTIHVAVGDSLLWAYFVRSQLPGFEGMGGDHVFAYATEDAEALRETFSLRFTAVVGNPPYITVKDKGLNPVYRERYKSCSGKYSLGVPFTELCFNLATSANADTGRPAGFVGLITANSFMKREFGKKLIEKYIPTWDLTHVVDTSGAYIPGHGTPTVILFGRNQLPVADTIRTVMGIRGEPSTPADPAKGLVWSAIVDQIDHPGSESDYISVADTDRNRFSSHPWSIGGGGAAELKESLDRQSQRVVGSVLRSVGFASFPGADDVFFGPRGHFDRHELKPSKPVVLGDNVRDFRVTHDTWAFAPYDADFKLLSLDENAPWYRHVWTYRTNLTGTISFGGKTRGDLGDGWWGWYRWVADKYRTPLSIAFAFVATHNHFVLDRGGKVFNRSAPVIKLPAGATVEDHLGLLALLNSSVACFWMQQQFHNKGNRGGERSTGRFEWEAFFEFDGTKLQQFPLPAGARPVDLGRRLDELASEMAAHQSSAVAESGVPTRERLEAARSESERLFGEMVSVQEELDWHCLDLYGLTEESLTVPEGMGPPPLALGERAFEIVLARKVAAGEVETAWFTRHRSTPITELPAHWPEWYRELVQRRIDLIESDRNVGLVERPEHKRRWARTSWDDLEAEALRGWLLDRLEDRSLWFDGDRATVRTLAQLADRIAGDGDWMEVARLWAGQVDIDPLAVVTKLAADEHVPAQAAARYKDSGLKKRAEWERTWELQRAEDRGEDVGRIAVPPKYAQGDFAKASYWKQRGKLDVPKERFVSVQGAERDAPSGDSSMVLMWAGFDHAQQAQALATLLFQRQTGDGWSGEQLVPLIAALDEVVPWVQQWHPDVDPGLGQPLGAFYRGQVDQALAAIGATCTTLADWRPPAATRGRARKAPSKKVAAEATTTPLAAEPAATDD
jgi:hypothetical protein